MTTLYFEGKTTALEDDAKGVLSLLWATYPGHPWAVKCDTGMIFIRHLGFDGKWGMNLKVSEVDHDAAVMKKKIVMLAGEWLERVGMIRGRHDSDQEIEHVEGVPQKYQPHQPLPDTMTVKRVEGEIREERRPQVSDA